MAENTETAILAGGCYWVTQELMRHCPGVISIRAGWTGGEGESPTEEKPGGHAEAIKIVFDSGRVSYRDVLELFFQIHRPDLGPGVVGSSYRSEIFVITDEQRQVAEKTIADVDAAYFWPGKVTTEITAAGPFVEADADDQDYFQRYPDSSQFPHHQPTVKAAERVTAA